MIRSRYSFCDIILIMNDLDQYIKSKQSKQLKSSSFVEYLYSLMDKYGFKKASDVYDKANISRQLWSSIISEKSKPSLNVCIKIVFTLKCDNHECKYLLKKAGFTLASSDKFALVVRYCIENHIYDIQKLNDMLEERNLPIVE